MNIYSEPANLQPSNQALLDRARLDMLVRHSPVAVMTSMVLILLILPILWYQYSLFFWLIWLSLQVMLSAGRLLFYRYIGDSLSDKTLVVSEKRVKHLEYLCALTIFVSGALFGSLSLAFSTDWPLLAQFSIPFLVAGLTAGAIASNMSSVLNYQAFIIPLLSSLAYAFYIAGMSRASLFIIVYYFVMTTLITKINRLFVNVVSLEGDKSNLVMNLLNNNEQLRTVSGKLQNSEQLLAGAFDNAAITMMLVDNNLCIIRANKQACLMLAYDARQLSQLKLTDLMYENEKSQSREAYNEIIAGNKSQIKSQKYYLRQDGIDIWVQESVSSVRGEHGQFQYGIIHAQDITEERRLNNKLVYQANHDGLTGLKNRYAFETTMQRLFVQDAAKSPGEQHVLCYIDLDQFKVINDTFGHSVGDELLRQLASILRKHIRRSDMLTRIGGDEFALLLFNCSIEVALKHVESMLEQIRAFTYYVIVLLLGTIVKVR